MRSTVIFLIILSLAVFGPFSPALSMETDQYNLPPIPLADIGDEVTQHVADVLQTAIATVNAEITLRESCLAHTAPRQNKCGTPEPERQRLAYLRSNTAVAQEVYNQLGAGNIFVSKSGQWMNSHHFKNTPERYKTSYTDSIYVAQPIDYATLSPTVRMYGVEFGTDKIDHIFQQGYKYNKIYNDAVRDGSTPQQAAAKAVKWGRMTERTFFGLLVSGVYSNADLAANFVGMRFYQGLSQPMEINGRTRPAILTLRDGKWEFASGADLSKYLLKPFIGDQLNEALNPSGYTALLFPLVKRVVKNKSCPKWRTQFPDLSATDLQNRSESLHLWNGEDYGFTPRDKTVNLAEVCFYRDKGNIAAR